MTIMDQLADAAKMSAGMAWQTGWSLVLGFTVSAVLQSTVSSESMQKALGRDGLKQIAIATAAGAASSSCSYASAAIMRTLFKKGAALATALAFLFASTNLVLELGLILLILLGWQFMLGQWIGGLVLIGVMTALVKLTAPKALVEAARSHEEASGGHQHMSMQAEGDTWWDRVKNPKTRILVAQNFAMEWSMLWKDLLIGFVVGGAISSFVPAEFWKTIFLQGRSPWIAVPVDALLGPVIAVVTFVCSVGNIPLAAILWASGASFGGVLAFIYADLIVLPLLDTYRRYFGWRMAAYIGVVFFATMVASGIIVETGFLLAGLVPPPASGVKERITHFSLDYTFWLNLAFGCLALWLFWLNHKNPMDHGHDHGSGHDHPRNKPGGVSHAHHPHHRVEHGAGMVLRRLLIARRRREGVVSTASSAAVGMLVLLLLLLAVPGSARAQPTSVTSASMWSHSPSRIPPGYASGAARSPLSEFTAGAHLHDPRCDLPC